MYAPKLIMSAGNETVRISELHAGWGKAERQEFDDLVADAVRKTAAREPRFLNRALAYIHEPGGRPTDGSFDRDRLRQDALDLCARMVREYVLECELLRGVNDTRPTSLVIRDFVERAIDKLSTLFLRARVRRTGRHRQTVGRQDHRYRIEASHVPATDEILAELAAHQAADGLCSVIDAIQYRQLFTRVAQLAEAGELADPESGRKMRADRIRTVAQLAQFLAEAGADQLDLYFTQEGELMIAPLHRDLVAAGLSYDRSTVDRMWRDVAAAAIQLERSRTDAGPSRFERTDR